MREYNKFINSISLDAIQPMELLFSRRGDFLDDGSLVNIQFKLAYPEEALVENESKIIFRPLFEINLFQNESIFYSQKVAFAVVIKIKDRPSFDNTWANEEIKKQFKEFQIKKTLWPILRQQVLDGMSRVGLPSISLPWIIN